MFRYRSKNFFYIVAKTLCIVVGTPLYAVGFLIEMVLTFINMLFAWIPFLSVVVTVVCKLLISLAGSLFYISVLPDLKEYIRVHREEISYEIEDACDSDEPNEDAPHSDDTDDLGE